MAGNQRRSHDTPHAHLAPVFLRSTPAITNFKHIRIIPATRSGMLRKVCISINGIDYPSEQSLPLSHLSVISPVERHKLPVLGIQDAKPQAQIPENDIPAALCKSISHPFVILLLI